MFLPLPPLTYDSVPADGMDTGDNSTLVSFDRLFILYVPPESQVLTDHWIRSIIDQLIDHGFELVEYICNG